MILLVEIICLVCHEIILWLQKNLHNFLVQLLDPNCRSQCSAIYVPHLYVHKSSRLNCLVPTNKTDWESKQHCFGPQNNISLAIHMFPCVYLFPILSYHLQFMWICGQPTSALWRHQPQMSSSQPWGPALHSPRLQWQLWGRVRGSICAVKHGSSPTTAQSSRPRSRPSLAVPDWGDGSLP